MQLSEAERECAANDIEATELRHSLLEKEQEIGRMSENMETLQSRLQVLKQQATTEEAVEEEMEGLVGKISILRVQIAKAESERQGMTRNVELVLRNKKQLEEWITSLQRIITVSVQA